MVRRSVLSSSRGSWADRQLSQGAEAEAGSGSVHSRVAAKLVLDVEEAGKLESGVRGAHYSSWTRSLVSSAAVGDSERRQGVRDKAWGRAVETGTVRVVEVGVVAGNIEPPDEKGRDVGCTGSNTAKGNSREHLGPWSVSNTRRSDHPTTGRDHRASVLGCPSSARSGSGS